MIEVLDKNTGRMSVVVPHGVLFRGSSEKKIRKKLVEENLLDAVIGLPANLFYGTSIPTALLIFRTKKSNDNVLFIDASREYEDNKNQNRLRETDIVKIHKTYLDRNPVEKYAHLASFEEIKANDYNLNITRYVDTFEDEEEVDIPLTQKEIKDLEEQLADVQRKMTSVIKELGYDS